MDIFGSLQSLIGLVFWVALMGLSVFGLVDALRHRPDAFTAAGKASKNIWLAVLGIAVAPDDRRRKLLALSTIGQELLDEARPSWSAAQARFEGQFGAAEAERLRTTLMQVTNVPLRADAGGPDGGEK